MFFPNACDVMAGFLGGRSNNINNSTGNAFVHESFKTNFTTSASAKKDEVLTSFPGTLTLTNNCQVLNCPECSKPCTGYTVVNTQVRQCSDSSSWYNCNVCCARFPALRDLEAHVATQVRYCCCVCHAGFHCRELYENHIAEHKNDLMNHQQVHLHQQPVTVNCDAGRKATHSFAVDQLATVSASTSASGGFLPSITQTMSIAGQIPDQVVAFTELARSQQGSFFVAAPPSTNYVTQDYISIMSKDANGKETYNINSFQLNKIQGKDLLREAYCGNSNITSNLADAEAQKEATEMQNISNQESYATIAVSIQSLTEAGKSCDFQNQTMTQQSSNNNLEMEAGRQDNPQNQPSVDDKMANPPISFVQFSDQPPMSHQQFVCTLCGKGFKTKITLGKHARTVHKIESATGADLMDFLTTSVTAVARLQQPSPSNTAVPGLDKINLLEGSALAEAMFNSATKEQTANVIGTDLVEEKKIFQSVRENEDVHQEKKRRSRGRKGPLGLTSTSRYQSSRVKYTCEVCDKEFIDKMKHRVHVRTHTGEKPYACDICGKLFNTRSQVNRHRLHIHELEGKPRNRQYKNRQSGDSTGKSAEMTGGVNVSFGESLASVNTSQQNNTGSTEGQNTSSAQESLNQSTASNDALANSIVYCSKTGQPVEISDGSSGQHRRRRGLHRIYFCPVCEKPFQDKVKHAVHLRTHTGEKPYACIVCDKRFNTRSQVNRHMSVHKSIFQNPLDTTFSSEGALEGIKSEDVGQEVVPEVQLSQQDSHNILRLQVGVQSGNLGQDETPQNGKTQSSKKKRNRDWQQSHMCSFCGQNFATPSGLSSHTRNRHKDQIVFNHNLFDASTGAVGNSGQGKAVDASKVCQVCGKAFRAANSLRMHMIRHSSIKPHKCPICERCFITKFESNRCQRRHSKTKAQDNTFQQEKANQMKVGSNDATVVQAFIPENLPQAAAQGICQRTGVVEDIATVPRTEAVAFPVTTNFSELADPSASNLPVNLSSQESWLQQGYIQTSIQQQQQNRDAFMQKAVVAHYQQMQVPSHSPHHQLFQQPIPEQLFQVMSHNMLTHYTIQQQDGFQQQQQQQQQQTQQQPVDQMMNNSKRRRRMII